MSTKVNSQSSESASAEEIGLPFVWMATIGLALLGMLYFAQITFYADSEIWPVSLSVEIWNELLRPSVYLKFSTHLFLWISSLLATSDLEVFFWARTFFAINGIFVWWLTFQLSRIAFGKNAAWAAGLLLALSPTFTNQIFRIRSDSLSVTFFLLIALLFVKAASVGQRKFPTSVYPFAILLVLSTPKSIYFLIALVPLWRLFPDRPRLPAWGWGGALGGAFLVVATLYKDAVVHLLAHFQGGPAIPDYLSIESFVYVWRVIRIDPIITFGLLLFLFRPKKQLGLQRSLWLVILITLITVLVHNEKLPFFIGSRMPLFAVGAGVAMAELLAYFRPSSVRWMGMAFPLVLFGHFCQFQSANGWVNSNDSQQRFIATMGQMMKQNHPQSQYWDAIGVLPLRKPLLHFLGPGNLEHNHINLANAQKDGPDFIFLTNKFEFVLPEVTAWLSENYLHLGGGIYGRATSIPSEDTVSHDLIIDSAEFNEKLQSLDAQAKTGLMSIRAKTTKPPLVIITYRDGQREHHVKAAHQVDLNEEIDSVQIHGAPAEIRLAPFWLRQPYSHYTGGLIVNELFRFDPHAL